MYSISKLASKYQLSRTALLYYESIGLLVASERTPAGYRVYCEKDAERLGRIVLFRDMGIPLEVIKDLLQETETGVTTALLKQLQESNQEIQALRDRQDRIIKVLQKTNILYQCVSTKNQTEFHKILAGAGIDSTNALQWHQDFDKASPEEHQRFLKAIGFTVEEIQELFQLVKNNPDHLMNRFLQQG
jgi:DNA-binding transcriptional MerR regulator